MTRWLALLGQVVLWVLALWYLLRVRVRQDEGNDLSGVALVAAPPAPRHVVIGADLDDLFGTREHRGRPPDHGGSHRGRRHGVSVRRARRVLHADRDRQNRPRRWSSRRR